MPILPGLRPIVAVALCVGGLASVAAQNGPRFVDITWMSMANLHYQAGDEGIVTDGYITRIPEEAFFGGPSAVTTLLTGHSHWDHSFDTATWSKLTGAPIIGSRSTCLQARAEEIPADRCTVVDGGEVIELAPGLTMFVVRWNHSGDPERNPEQHDPVELDAVPTPDPSTGGLRAGVAEDFPNGGGSRGFLFVADGPDGPFSWFQQSSASEVDIDVPVVVDGVDHGAPLANLEAAMAQAGLESVDLWIGTGGYSVARRVVPVIWPDYYLPIHWDGLWEPFEAGLPRLYAGGELEAYSRDVAVELVPPAQYMDRWRLDASGLRPVNNDEVKQTLGFDTR